MMGLTLFWSESAYPCWLRESYRRVRTTARWLQGFQDGIGDGNDDGFKILHVFLKEENSKEKSQHCSIYAP